MFWRLFLTFALSSGLAAAATAVLVLHRTGADRSPELIVRVLLAAGLVLGLALAPAWYFAGRLTRPLRDLTAEARRLARGGYEGDIRAGGAGEVRTLARTFSDLGRELAARLAQLERDRQQLRTILGGMIEGVIAVDASEQILFANDRAAGLLGFDRATAAGRKFWEVVRQRPLQELLDDALTRDEPTRRDLDWVGPAVRHLAVYAARLPGSPTPGAILVLHDVTELRRLERVRQEFVANVSHELKTPLAVIAANVEALLDGAAEDPAARRPFLEQVAEQAERLHSLILDLLSLARIESGEMHLQPEPIPVADAVARCLERHRKRAEAKKQHLLAEDPGEAPAPEVWADDDALREILDNLVDNALKYTPEGGTIRVRWRAEGGRVRLEVEDDGIGIPLREQPRIFERFYRVDKGRSRAVGGTGLGLAIVKHLVQALRGTIRVASEPGRGTTFTVHLPRAPGA
ncbi:MAG TPA: ATP-binding protein [Gemmataceae bacterium]